MRLSRPHYGQTVSMQCATAILPGMAGRRSADSSLIGPGWCRGDITVGQHSIADPISASSSRLETQLRSSPGLLQQHRAAIHRSSLRLQCQRHPAVAAGFTTESSTKFGLPTQMRAYRSDAADQRTVAGHDDSRRNYLGLVARMLNALEILVARRARPFAVRPSPARHMHE